jgi:predicted Zn-dependent protease
VTGREAFRGLGAMAGPGAIVRLGRWGRQAAAGLAVCALMGGGAGPAAAQDRVSLIRDAEIEQTIRAYSRPIFEVAGLNPNAIAVYLINDPRLNAFVAGGQNIFINTGLLMSSKDPGGVIGVIAHETGHIAGGHLARLNAALNNASAQRIIDLLLGVAAGLATGNPGVGGAVITGSSSGTLRSLLAYNRAQESSADQSALTYLDRLGWSATGIADFLEVLEDQELVGAQYQDPYLRSHPITRERVDFARNHVLNSPYSDARFPDAFYVMHERMRAKLIGFTAGLTATLQAYPESDTSLPARYARAIAHAQRGDLNSALPLIDSLLAEAPSDPYFLELKGQILFENGRIADAVPLLRQAVSLAPEAGPIRLMLAHALLELNDPAFVAEAAETLQAALRGEPTDSQLWHFLAIAYGRQGDLGNAALAQAESYYHDGNDEDARQQAQRAQQNLPNGSPGWLRAQDILSAPDDEDD